MSHICGIRPGGRVALSRICGIRPAQLPRMSRICGNRPVSVNYPSHLARLSMNIPLLRIAHFIVIIILNLFRVA